MGVSEGRFGIGHRDAHYCGFRRVSAVRGWCRERPHCLRLQKGVCQRQQVLSLNFGLGSYRSIETSMADCFISRIAIDGPS